VKCDAEGFPSRQFEPQKRLVYEQQTELKVHDFVPRFGNFPRHKQTQLSGSGSRKTPTRSQEPLINFHLAQ